MIRRPKFKNHFQVEIVEPDLVLLLSENDCIPLRGRLTTLLAPFVDGKHTVDDILKKVKGRATFGDVHYGLSLLEKAGVVIEGDETEPLGVAAFRDFLNVDPNLFRSRLEGASVSVVSLGGIPIDPFLAILESLHVRVAEASTFRVVLTDDYSRKELEGLNRQILAMGLPWMIVKPVGAILWIGPIFNPPRTGCWGCLAKRLKEHRLLQTSRDTHRELEVALPPLSKSLLPSTLHLAMDIAATEILKWIVQAGNESAEGKLITFDVRSTTLEKHVLVRQESCPDCGISRGSSRTPCDRWVLTSQKKAFTSDGGHRAVFPHEAFRRYEHHISPITGIVDGLRASYSGGGGLVQVFEADLNSAIRLDRRLCWGRGFGRKSFGKGITEIQAKTSALCEALERYAGVFQSNETRMKASYRSLGAQAIHPNQCMSFSRRQYNNRDEWNQRESEYNWVPQPFDEEREVEWTPVWSLTEERYKYVPTAYCYFAYPYSADHDFCRADSNGNAAGSTLEEAILQGFLEVVERDSVGLWWYNHLSKPGVNLDSLGQPYIGALRAHYDAYHREIQVLDITSDFGIPAFAALCRSARPDKRDLFFGFGAHFDPEIAMSRALTEMNQFLPDLLAGNLTPVFVNEIRDGAFLEPDTTVAPKCAPDFPNLGSDDLREDVMTCIKLARERGLEVLVLDQTRPDIGLRVVKVFVPGMRHFWARFGPGRLYDVPVAMGWVERPLTEDQLNPSHLVI
jgi:ribosomal protein S12 methylthiotransferase accessory factor